MTDAPDGVDGFRARFRTWLAEHAPAEPGPMVGADRAAFWSRWHRSLYEGGWMGLSWPVEYGGQGLAPIYEAVFNDEIGRAGAPPAPHVGFLGRALLHAGTDAQRHRFLPGLLSGDEVWCQGFSEPGAGSDLGSLRTRADRSPAGYVVNGQKVWTSDAAWADWCLLLVRTDPDAPKHRGISALLVDMRTPGIEVRPITQINGDTEFNEVFFTDVVVPPENLLGREGEGWSIAMTTVAYERGPADVGFTSRYARLIRELVESARSTPPPPRQRLALARAHVHVEVLRAHVEQSLGVRDDAAPGADGSIGKLLGTRTEQLLHHTAVDLDAASVVTGRAPRTLAEYLYSRAASIAGGTSEIQRTIVAERLLGLPRSR